jgi:two-component sensor histidine kinase
MWCVTWKLYRPDGTFLPHDECPMAIALKEQRPVRGAEAIAERPDGTRVPFIPFPTPIRDANGRLVGAVNMLVDISERRQSETAQQVLIRELNHRVKNNMQMLDALLKLAIRKTTTPDAKEVLEDASRRVATMAAAQRVLYESGATTFGADEFLRAVGMASAQAFESDIEIVVSEASGTLSNDAAMPLALILNELLVNAVKHGVNGRGKGTVRIGLRNGGEECIVYVEDDGPGFDPKRTNRHSGLDIVTGLARQIGGTFSVEQLGGTRCSVRFPAAALTVH